MRSGCCRRTSFEACGLPVSNFWRRRAVAGCVRRARRRFGLRLESGLNRRRARVARVVAPAGVFQVGLACPCFELPAGRRGVRSEQPGVGFTVRVGLRRRAALARRASAMAGVRGERRARVEPAPLPCAPGRGRKERRVRRGRRSWDSVGFAGSLAAECAAFADRAAAVEAFVDALPVLSAPAARHRLPRGAVVGASAVCVAAVCVPPGAARRRSERNFVRAHGGHGKARRVAGAKTPKPSRREQFAARVAVLLRPSGRKPCTLEDMARRACYVLDANGARVLSGRFFGEAGGMVMYLSAEARNQKAHMDNGNTVKRTVSKARAKAAAPPARSVPLETLVVDPTRCQARTWNAGAGRQCARKPCDGRPFCAQHAKTLTNGTVVGEVEAAIQEKYDKANSRGLGAKGFAWYSRVKLWDETRLLGKLAVSALTDAEFQRALYNIDRFFKMHATLIGQWRLQKNAGPQSAADRQSPGLVDYLGSPRRYMWYSATIFKQELAKWPKENDGVVGELSVEDLSEAAFVELLKRTSSRAANHGIVRNYAVAFSGPQSWVQRSDAGVMELEPLIEGRRVEFRPKDFEWLQCSGACQRWRRVDLSTARAFSNWHWRQHEREERRAALCGSFPRLPAEVGKCVASDGGGGSRGAVAAGDARMPHLDIDVVGAYLERAGLQDALSEEHRWGLLELVAVECRRRNRPCGAVQLQLEALQNEASGPVFRCEMLANTTCEDACDHEQLFARHEPASYRESAAATVHWSTDDGAAAKVDGRVVRVDEKAAPVATGVCVVPGCGEAWDDDRPHGRTFSSECRKVVSSLSGLCRAVLQQVLSREGEGATLPRDAGEGRRGGRCRCGRVRGEPGAGHGRKSGAALSSGGRRGGMVDADAADEAGSGGRRIAAI